MSPPGKCHQVLGLMVSQHFVLGLMVSQHLEPREKMLHSPLTKGQRGLSRWREVRSELACSTPCRGQGWGRDRDMEARKIRLLCHTGHNPHRGRAANLLRKSKGEGRDVFMPPHLCPCCSSLPNVFPIYCPHLSLCCSLRHHSNVIYTMEFTLTSRMSSSLLKT